jgi:hypothetical protein
VTEPIGERTGEGVLTGSRRRLTGRIRVGLPPAGAFRLFTPRGEQDWVPGWKPRFPAPVSDDTEPGTVFETGAHGHRTVWLVLDRQPGRRISYARVTPGDRAGTVTVVINAANDHEPDEAASASDVEVIYELTALTEAAARDLAEFARTYPAYLQSWQEAIAAWLGGRLAPHSRPSAHRLGPSHGQPARTAIQASADARGAKPRKTRRS